MMMNILLIATGSRGDVNPYLAIGIALKNRGHQVTLMSIDLYESHAHEAGLTFISCGSNEDYYTAIRHPDASSRNLKKGFKVLADYLILGFMKPVYEIALKRFSPKDTVIIAPGYMYGARLLQEKHNFPLITLCLQPFFFLSAEDPSIGADGSQYHLRWPVQMRRLLISLFDKLMVSPALSKKVNGFRKTLDLKPAKNIFMKWCYSPTKVIGAFPEWFGAPAKDWPPNTELCGFIQYDEHPEDELSAEVEDFIQAGEKPIVLTYGTSVSNGDVFFKHALEAARQLGLRCLILSVHDDHLPSLESERELYVPYVPFKKVLPLCAALVHSGGIGTIAQGLAAAIPQLTVPFVNDQPDNGFRLEKLGVSLNVPIEKWTTESAVLHLQKLLASHEIKECCEQYSKQIDFEKTEQKICEIAEGMGS